MAAPAADGPTTTRLSVPIGTKSVTLSAPSPPVSGPQHVSATEDGVLPSIVDYLAVHRHLYVTGPSSGPATNQPNPRSTSLNLSPRTSPRTSLNLEPTANPSWRKSFPSPGVSAASLLAAFGDDAVGAGAVPNQDDSPMPDITVQSSTAPPASHQAAATRPPSISVAEEEVAIALLQQMAASTTLHPAAALRVKWSWSACGTMLYHCRLHGRDVEVRIVPPAAYVELATTVKTLARLRDAYCVAFEGLSLIPDVGVALVTEFVDGGSLGWRLAHDDIPTVDGVQILVQVAHGLRHVHALGIVHGDLRPENVYLTSTGTAKLAGFEYSLAIDDPDLRQPLVGASDGAVAGPSAGVAAAASSSVPPLDTFGHYSHAAPELLHNTAAHPWFESDVFSFGVIMYEVLTGGCVPFEQVLDRRAADASAPIGFLLAIRDQPLRALVEACLVPLPHQRPTMSEVYVRAWLHLALLTRPDMLKPSERLELAIVSGDHGRVCELLATASPAWSRFWVITAAMIGDAALVDILLKWGAYTGTVDELGNSALHYAAACGATDVIAILLAAARCNVNATNSVGTTPLLEAVTYGRLGAARMLLDAGASPRLANSHRVAPLHVAALRGSVDLVELLVSFGAYLSAQTLTGLRPIHCALRAGHKDVLVALSTPSSAVTPPENGRAGAAGVAPGIGTSTGDASARRLSSGSVAAGRESTILEEGYSILVDAIYVGSADVIKTIIEQGVDVEARDESGWTPLQTAAYLGKTEIVRLLLAYANVDAVSLEGFSALFVACYEGHSEVIALLLAAGADVSHTTSAGYTALYNACAYGWVEIVDLLLAYGADVNQVSSGGATPLCVACYQGHAEVVRRLLRSDAAVNAFDQIGATPAYNAAAYGHADILEVLVQREADLEQADIDGLTPLLAAVQNNRTRAVQVLVVAGVDVDRSGGVDEATPLLLASRGGYLGIVSILVSSGADMEKTDRRANTPLAAACCEGRADVAAYLIRAGASVSTPGQDGCTPLYNAASYGYAPIVRNLLAAGAQADTTNVGSRTTSMYMAAAYGYVEVVDALLGAGANPNLCEITGSTPVAVAAYQGHLDVVLRLIRGGADLELSNRQGFTPLLCACHQGHGDIVSVLLAAGVNAAHCDDGGRSAVYVAADAGAGAIVDLLLAWGAEVDVADAVGLSPLGAACRKGFSGVVRSLLGAGASVTGGPHSTPMFEAANAGCLEAVVMLGEAGADPSVPVLPYNQMPLHAVASSDRYDVAAALLAVGADPNAVTDEGCTPVTIAAQEGNCRVLQVLLDAPGVDPDLADMAGFSPLAVASQNGHFMAVALLIQHGAEVNRQAHNGMSPLYNASAYARAPVVSMLLAAGADPNAAEQTGATPLMVSAFYNHVNVVERLLADGRAAVDAVDSTGSSALFISAAYGCLRVVKLLLAAGANPRLVNNDGLTPFDVAREKGYSAVVAALVKGLRPAGEQGQGRPGGQHPSQPRGAAFPGRSRRS